MAVNILVPELGESVVQATVGRWLKHEGDHINVGETVVELETDKVDLEVGATSSGTLSRIEKKEGEDVHAGEVLGMIEATSEEPSSNPEKPPEPPQTKPAKAEPVNGGNGDRATPVAARLAKEQGLDVTSIPGTGPGGRVTKVDVQTFVEKQKPPAPPKTELAEPAPAPAAPPSRPSPQQFDREERVRMSRRRRTIAERLLQVSQNTAMLTTFNEVDMSQVMELRRKHRDGFKERFGVNLGLSSFFVKAAVGALKAFPQINAEIQGEELVLKHHYDIGIAVGASEGLVVPVLHEADRLSFGEIEKKIKESAEKAESGQLGITDLTGGTFTITNGGIFGSLMSTPILNPPQVAILGLHKIEDRPVAIDGQVVIRPMMYVALSYDHRAVDGREAVQFLARVKQLVQDPETLLLET